MGDKTETLAKLSIIFNKCHKAAGKILYDSKSFHGTTRTQNFNELKDENRRKTYILLFMSEWLNESYPLRNSSLSSGVLNFGDWDEIKKSVETGLNKFLDWIVKEEKLDEFEVNFEISIRNNLSRIIIKETPLKKII